MRQKHSILLVLPAANALSLANFQSISLASIPLICQLTYDGQIPSCQVSDFNTGCTPACVAGLNTIAAEVKSACEGTHVTANSLLGIIQSGGIQGALCPTLAKVTTTSQAKTTTALSNTAKPNSVTIPTDSAGVTGGLGFVSSTSALATTTTTHASSTISVTANSTSKPATTSTTSEATTASTSTSAESMNTITGSTLSTVTSSKTSASTSSNTAKSTTKAQTGGSGGGSPFDTSSGVGRLGQDSMLALVVLVAWAGILLGR